MILVDFNQMVIANFMQFQKMFSPGEEVNMLRHMIFNNVRMLNRKFKDEFGEMVFCCDGKDNWRKQVFEHYKANRKKDREKNVQNVDWQALFDSIEILKNDFNEHFPYKVLRGHGCEADDIIATLCKHYREKILIISSDKDFIQLQKYENVRQWSPLKKKFIVEKDPIIFKNQLIIKGDRGDGVPNILSSDDTFVSQKRQKKLTKVKIEEWSKSNDIEHILDQEVYRNFKRNQQLIDLDFVPDSVEINILDDFKSDHFTGRSKMLNYFIKHRLKELTESLQEF